MEIIPNLNQLFEDEFEVARWKIINDHLISLPDNVSSRMRAFQMTLDIERDRLQTAHNYEQGNIVFMRDCFKKISENLVNLSDAYDSVSHISGLKQPSLPNYTNERITKI